MTEQTSPSPLTPLSWLQAQDERLTGRLEALLPPMYRERYQEVLPVSMGSAGLQFDSEGRVAWHRIWGSFCHLAMAGGPPHKGRLLQPASPEAVGAEPARYTEVTAEIVRGLQLAAGLQATPGAPGWVRLQCANDTMAAWMLRAITMENVAVRHSGSMLDLPAGPAFRLEKEIKNVITVATKTAHYWQEHMPRTARSAARQLLDTMDAEQVCLTPAYGGPQDGDRQQVLRDCLVAAALHGPGLRTGGSAYAGWLGFECDTVERAVAMMRLVLVCNVLTRREETVLFVPLNAVLDPGGMLVLNALQQAHGYLLRRQPPA